MSFGPILINLEPFLCRVPERSEDQNKQYHKNIVKLKSASWIFNML